ncbi:VanZ family protein [Actinosynnema pretiosum]|uniref:VanZ family protein n=1 Tax=Actinosynnema pretiosum TaxID=42197 RepID=A0A290Z9P1_9PSEU|nr:VanZ family protein [Actinosynnema pretiosum]ATE55706.1 VanZ family protein [Actinosynnema pretiosum]
MPGTPRTRGIVLTTAAVLVLAAVLLALRRPLMMSAPACAAGRWHGCLDTENGVVLVALVGAPVAVLAAWGLARLRGAGSWRASVAEVGLVYGTVPWLWITLMPGERAGEVPGRLSLVPLADLLEMGPLGVLGNLLVFAALGFFAPVRFPALASAPRVLALGAVCSLLVETAQCAFRLDRVSSVDDVLLNATGAALAALASRRWWARSPRRAAARP